MEQIKIREVYQKDRKFELKTDVNVEGTITLGRNFMLDIFEIYMSNELNKQEYRLGENIEEIIKVHIPQRDDDALDVLENGIDFDNNHYVYLCTSAGLMKKADMEFKTESEAFFIEDTYKEFKDVFEDAISLGNIEKKKGTELCINKDIVARISLALSSGERVHLPGIKRIILPEMTYKFVNNYLQFPSKIVENEKGENTEVLDLDKVRAAYETGEKNSVLEQYTEPVEHVAMDGSGFISPALINKIKKQLNDKHKANIDYSLSWIGIRELGLQSKGLLVKFDWKKYLREEHGLNELYISDRWGKKHDIFKVDIIMNESQCKWAKWFDSYEEYEKSINEFANKDERYKELFESLYIIKYSKEKADNVCESNYQVIGNLALTADELNKIDEESEDIYKKAIEGNLAIRRILMGDIARENQTELSASTKAHRLLQHDEKFNETKMIKNVVDNLINKKIHMLAGASIYLNNSNYKTAMKDPISYIDSLVELKNNPDNYIYKKVKNEDTDEEIEVLKGIKGKISKDGLKEHTNYVPGEIGKRVLARCPLNSPGENIKTELVQNSLLDKYFGHLSNDIIFYAFDDNMMKQSGMDEDLDITLCIDNDIIYNSVIEDVIDGTIWHFRNQLDGGSNKEIYTDENLYQAIVEGRGNKIGELSNVGSICSNRMHKQLPEWRCENVLMSEFDIRENLYNKYKDMDGIDKADINNFIERDYKLGISKCKKEPYDTEDHRQNVLNNFQKEKVNLYFLLYAQMKAIDSPKTGLKIDEELKFIDKYIKNKGELKPRFIYHAKYKKLDKTVEYRKTQDSNTLLNNFARRINDQYGYKTRELFEQKYDDDHLIKILRKIDVEVSDELKDKLTELSNDWHKKRANLEESITLEKLSETKKTYIRYKVDKEFKENIDDEFNRCIFERKPKVAKIELDIQKRYENEIKGHYTKEEILRAAGDVKGNKKDKFGNKVNITSTFIMKFLFDELDAYLLEKNNKKGSVYVECMNGDNRFLFKNYKKTDIELKELTLGKDQLINSAVSKKVNVIVKTNIRGMELNEDVIDGLTHIVVENGEAFKYENEDKTRISLGKIYENTVVPYDGIYELDSVKFKNTYIEMYVRV
ncbi:hypothetical protein D4A35_01925 [Paraclostridium bifermentans]|uniref:Uncharacterized protein n=1 Tax=Paraclostridium bifermentans TaxID=1490 RepID=A0A5P3XEI8_PARBF|nr:hypothetical protein [Paraclostridium bifermentans]QEZ67751.1 hypothetical protein D4A35_01925 [Paraclostridium bifermentans]